MNCCEARLEARFRRLTDDLGVRGLGFQGEKVELRRDWGRSLVMPWTSDWVGSRSLCVLRAGGRLDLVLEGGEESGDWNGEAKGAIAEIYVGMYVRLSGRVG